MIFFYLFNICFAIGFCHDTTFPFALAMVPFALLHRPQQRKTPSQTLKKHLADKRKSSPFAFPAQNGNGISSRNGYSAIIPFRSRDYAVSTENALLGESRSRTECHAPKKKAYASAILGTLSPNLFKIIDIARALCYYKQADNRKLHFLHRASDVWRSTQEAEGAPLLRE